jgi:hypothetical protein
MFAPASFGLGVPNTFLIGEIMEKYPQVITAEVLNNIANISDVQIEQDIRDTVAEISLLEKEVEALGILVETRRGTSAGKMSSFKFSAALDGLNARREFVQFLERVQVARLEKGE